jgi:hypothetical protein
MTLRPDIRTPADVARVVALGASNLTRGFQTVIATARAAWGPDVEMVAALGHGRSYGAHSTVVIRTLPGILQSGLWRKLESLPAVPTRGVVTDIGNDIIYGFSAEQTLAWVEEALNRLQSITRDIVLTDLPLTTIRRLSRAKFLALRSILAPACRLSLDQVVDRAERVNAGLAELAVARGIRFVPVSPDWYGFDAIHIRAAAWRPAWQEILGSRTTLDGYRGSRIEALRLLLMPPERQWVLGRERFSQQSGKALASGSRVWLY